MINKVINKDLTVINKDALLDTNLSLEAIGLYVTLIYCVEHNEDDFMKYIKDDEKQVAVYLKELKDQGYIDINNYNKNNPYDFEDLDITIYDTKKN